MRTSKKKGSPNTSVKDKNTYAGDQMVSKTYKFEPL